jgi:hypothetical protein
VTFLALVAVVLVPFAVFWWAGRDIKPKADGQKENAEEVFSNRWVP